jgi:hypothetical protein
MPRRPVLALLLRRQFRCPALFAPVAREGFPSDQVFRAQRFPRRTCLTAHAHRPAWALDHSFTSAWRRGRHFVVRRLAAGRLGHHILGTHNKPTPLIHQVQASLTKRHFRRLHDTANATTLMLLRFNPQPARRPAATTSALPARHTQAPTWHGEKPNPLIRHDDTHEHPHASILHTPRSPRKRSMVAVPRRPANWPTVSKNSVKRACIRRPTW